METNPDTKSPRTDATLWANYQQYQLAKILHYTPWLTISFVVFNLLYIVIDQFVYHLPILSYFRIIPCLLAISLFIGWRLKVPAERLFVVLNVWNISILCMFYACAIVFYKTDLFYASMLGLMIGVFMIVVLGAFDTRTIILTYSIPLVIFLLILIVSGMADRKLADFANVVILMVACVVLNGLRDRYALNDFKLSRQLEDTLTQLTTTQAQLIQREKLASLGELTAGIAHEIQNPLNFVKNFSELNIELVDELKQEVEAEQPDPAYLSGIVDDLKSNQQRIVHHSRRAENIVRNMLEHSRLSPGERIPTDLNTLARECLHLSYHDVKAKGLSRQIDCITTFDEQIGDVDMAPQEISRVLLNLLNNAFYAVQQREKQVAQQPSAGYTPTVTVSTRRMQDWVVAEISDNGTGIPALIKDKIFQPFFTTKPTGEGTGLGLSLSYDVVTKGHGGTLTVASTEGEGTTFTITLPATATH